MIASNNSGVDAALTIYEKMLKNDIFLIIHNSVLPFGDAIVEVGELFGQALAVQVVI